MALHLDPGLRSQIKFVIFSNAGAPNISDQLAIFVEKESTLSPVQLRWVRSPIPLELFSFLKKFSKELDLHEEDFFLWLQEGETLSSRFFTNLVKFSDSRKPTIVFPVIETPKGRKLIGYAKVPFFSKWFVQKFHKKESFESPVDLYPVQNKIIFKLKELEKIFGLLEGQPYGSLDFRHAPRTNPNLLIRVPQNCKYFRRSSGHK